MIKKISNFNPIMANEQSEALTTKEKRFLAALDATFPAASRYIRH